jgi:hypothetical protein
MADKKVNIEIGSKANASGFNMALGWFNQLRGGMSMFMGTAVMGGIMNALGKVVDFGRGAVKAFAEAEDGEMKLRTALQNAGGNVKGYMGQYIALAEQLQKTTKYEDDMIVAEMAHAVSLGVSRDKIAAMTQAAVGLSAKLGVDLGSAFDILIKAGNGSYMMFERASGGMKLVGSNAEKMQAIMKFATSGMKDATAATTTYNGATAQLNNTWGSTKETIGGVLIESMGLVEILKELNKEIADVNGGSSIRKVFESSGAGMKEWLAQAKAHPLTAMNAAVVKAFSAQMGAYTSDVGLPKVGDSGGIMPGSSERSMQGWAANEARKAAALDAIAANTGALPKLTNPQ